MITISNGFYGVIEGGDGCGKSTQVILLKDRLKKEGYDVFDEVEIREPGTTRAGELVRQILLESGSNLGPESQAFLFMASRSDTYDKIISSALNQGKVVLADRSVFSTLAYQGYAGGIDLDMIDKMKEMALKKRDYDLGVIIDVSAKDGLKNVIKNGNLDDIERQGQDFHERVNRGYSEMVNRYDNCRSIKYRQGDIRGMHEEIYSLVKKEIIQKIKRTTQEK